MIFAPLELPTKCSQRFYVIGDNGGSDLFTIEGESCTPEFELVRAAFSDERIPTAHTLGELLFDSLNPATPQTKRGIEPLFYLLLLIVTNLISSFCTKQNST